MGRNRLGRLSLLAALASSCTILSIGCVGSIGDGDAPEQHPPSTPTDFQCDSEQVPDSLPLKRLTHAQYASTVFDLVRFALPAESAAGQADAVIADITPVVAQLPDDLRLGPDKTFAKFTRLDQAVQQEHVDASYAVATAVGAALTSNAARLGVVAGSCATDADAANDDACLDAFIRSFGERALRRAVTDDDVAFYRVPAGAAPLDAPDYGDVIALMMTSPDALYFVESGDGKEGASVKLGAYELASRLSYHFWQSMPDEALFASARSGELLTETGYAAQVERVFADPKTHAAVSRFFSEWLENTALQELDSRVGDPVFDAFANGFTPGPDLREEMLAEVVDASTYYAFDQPGTYDDFVTSKKSFARTEDLASIYGVGVWDGASEPPDFAEPERAGLLTRAAYVATGSANTRPIMKGVFLRKALLCDDVALPPPNAAANPPALSSDLTTRQVVEQLTGSGVCASCHPTQINPLGFATENFDALGRVRTEQRFFDVVTGAVVGSAPIDTSGVPNVDEGDATPSANASDLTDLVVASKKLHACFARQYFRFTFGRIEDLDKDGCALADVKATLDSDKPLADVLRTVASSAAFQERSFEEGP